MRPHSSLGYRTPQEFAAANGCGKDGDATWATRFHFPQPRRRQALNFNRCSGTENLWELRYDWTKNGEQVLSTF